MYKLIIFDCFGTLVKNNTEHYFSSEKKEAYYFLKRTNPGLTYIHFKTVWKDTFNLLYNESLNTNVEFKMQQFVRKVQNELCATGDTELLTTLYLQEWLDGIEAIEGVSEMLQRLKQKYILTIASNTHTIGLVEQALLKCSISPSWFSQIVTSVSIGKRKPAPDMLNYIISREKIPKNNALVVGDSIHDDLGAAQKAKIDFRIVSTNKGTTQTYLQDDNLVLYTSILEVESEINNSV